MRSVSSIEPVGITNACTSVVVPNRSRMIVTVHSAMTPLGMSLLCGFRACSGTCSTTPVFCSFTIKLLYRKAEMTFAFVTGRHARDAQYYEPVLVCCENCDAGSHDTHLSPALHQDAV